MEQKRTLWIIAAVGVFLLVVLGAALIIYSPAPVKSQSISSFSSSNRNSPSNGWISLAPSTPLPAYETGRQEISVAPTIKEDSENKYAAQPKDNPEQNTQSENDKKNCEENSVQTENNTVKKISEMVVVADNATVFGVIPAENGKQFRQKKNDDFAENKASLPPSPPEQSVSQTIINNTTTIELASEEKVVKVNIPEQPVQRRNSQSSAKKTESAQNLYNKPVSKPAAPIFVPKSELSKTAKQPYAAESAPTKTQYWIQVTALTSRKSADNAREILDANKIAADVFTYTDNKRQLFYRVRVGPYTTRSEAEYWRSKISKIDSFENSASYITSTPVAQ